MSQVYLIFKTSECDDDLSAPASQGMLQLFFVAEDQNKDIFRALNRNDFPTENTPIFYADLGYYVVKISQKITSSFNTATLQNMAEAFCSAHPTVTQLSQALSTTILAEFYAFISEKQQLLSASTQVSTTASPGMHLNDTIKTLCSLDNVAFGATVGDKGGGASTILFYNLPHIQYWTSTNPAPLTNLPVAYAKLDPTRKMDSKHVNVIVQAKILLVQKHVPNDFNHAYLFRGTQGQTISQKAESDLLSFLRRFTKTLATADAIKFTAHMILAVYDYHSRNLVHRDIKIDNFLVFQHNSTFILKLADHDTVTEVNDAGSAINPIPFMWLTRNSSPPEMFLPTSATDKKEKRPMIAQETHQLLNFKAVDCYSLGYAIRCVAVHGCQEKASDHFNILHQSLRHKDVSQRWTVQQAMESPLFGATTAERKAFFVRVRAEAKAELIIDGYQVCAERIDTDNAFLLLDNRIKPVIYAALQFANNVRICATQMLTGISTDTKAVLVSNLRIMQQQKYDIVKSIQTIALPPSALPQIHRQLEALKNIATSESDILLAKASKLGIFGVKTQLVPSFPQETSISCTSIDWCWTYCAPK